MFALFQLSCSWVIKPVKHGTFICLLAKHSVSIAKSAFVFHFQNNFLYSQQAIRGDQDKPQENSSHIARSTGAKNDDEINHDNADIAVYIAGYVASRGYKHSGRNITNLFRKVPSRATMVSFLHPPSSHNSRSPEKQRKSKSLQPTSRPTS